MSDAASTRGRPALVGDGGPGAGLSNTPTSVAQLPSACTHLVEIPSSPHGIIDTIKLQVDCAPDLDDVRALLDGAAWSASESLARDPRVDGVFRSVLRVTRDRDGCRVTATERRVTVEVSVPRVLGLRNDEQHLVSEEDVGRVVRDLTEGLLPRTTLKARQSGSDWFLKRLDLAVNVAASIVEVIEVCRLVRYPQIRKDPVCWGWDGLSWYGKYRELVIYDRAARAVMGRKGRSVIRRSRGPHERRGVRIEFRLLEPSVLRVLEGLLETASDGLPILPCGDRREVTPRWYAVNHHALHRFLATQVASLRTESRLRPVADVGGVTLRQLALRQLVEHPEDLALVEGTYSSRTVRQLRSELSAGLAEEYRLDLVKAAWPGPRLSPMAWRALSDQRSASAAGASQ